MNEYARSSQKDKMSYGDVGSNLRRGFDCVADVGDVGGLDDGEGADAAVAPAGYHDGELFYEGRPFLGVEAACDAAQGGDGQGEGLFRLRDGVASAVVGVAAGLQHQRVAELVSGFLGVGDGVDLRELGQGDAVLLEVHFLNVLVLHETE